MRAFEFRFYDPISYIFIYSDWYEKMSEFFQAYEKTDWGRNSQLPLQQYTGLKDAEGNKVYEGDIVRGAWPGELKPMVVEYQAPSFIMRINKKQWSEFIFVGNQPFVIIGNKYQHGELLNEQK